MAQIRPNKHAVFARRGARRQGNCLFAQFRSPLRARGLRGEARVRPGPIERLCATWSRVGTCTACARADLPIGCAGLIMYAFFVFGLACWGWR